MIQKVLSPLLISLLIFAAGCQHFYNGWPASRMQESAEGPSYQPRQPASSSAGPSMPKDTPTPSRMQFAGPTGEAAPLATPPNIARDGRKFTRPLQLWGQLAGGRPRNWQSLDAARNVHQISDAGEGADFDPTVDPTDGSVVFASTRHRQTADLYRKNPDGQAITQLTNDRANDLMPAVSPDGKHIAFTSDRSGNWDLYLMSRKGGGKVVRLTSSSAHDIHPSFSPNGQRLVYSSYSPRAGQWQLVVRELDAPGNRQILGEGLFPEWAPSSDRIIYQRARQRGTRWFSVWQVSYNSGQASAPTELASSHKGALITPSWSPDGQRIVFCTVSHPTADGQKRPREADLWIMTADGSHHARLTSGQFANLQPAWGDSGRIMFVSDRGKHRRDSLWSLEPEAPLSVVSGGVSTSDAKAQDVDAAEDAAQAKAAKSAD